MKEWIDINKKLPDTKVDVLVWVLWGFQWCIEIASLWDSNGEDGFQYFYHPHFGEHKVPNEPFPKNLSWSIHGHSAEFNNVKFWMPLPNNPDSF